MAARPSFSLDQLVTDVNAWCDTRGLTPANGQSAEQLSPRTLRYYRTMGLIDGPVSGSKIAYTEVPRLQLCAIRILQAQGLPLRRIQTLLYGRSETDLRQILNKGAASLAPRPSHPALAAAEDWQVIPLDPSVWLILRDGRKLSPDQLARIQAILAQVPDLNDLPQPKPERTP